jgi:uncharacterized protein YdhG (YjbR/CyaY superfamily)
MDAKKNLKTCKKGHQFYKSSDCPTCPICEEERKPKDNFLSLIGAPARRALEREGITTLEILSTFSEKEILALHGMGKSTIPKLNDLLSKAGLLLKKRTMNEVELYISQFEPEIQSRLEILRQLFFEVLPDTEESIRYKMPAFKVGNHHLYFAAYKKHIGFYPVYGLTTIEDEILEYRAKKTKDSLHFTHDKPLPIDLLKKIIKLKSLMK